MVQIEGNKARLAHSFEGSTRVFRSPDLKGRVNYPLRSAVTSADHTSFKGARPESFPANTAAAATVAVAQITDEKSNESTEQDYLATRTSFLRPVRGEVPGHSRAALRLCYCVRQARVCHEIAVSDHVCMFDSVARVTLPGQRLGLGAVEESQLV